MMFEDNKFDSKVKESVHVLDKTDDEMLSEIAKEAISRSYFKYEYKVGDRNLSRGLSISDENISEIKVNNCMLYNNDTQVRMEVEGTASHRKREPRYRYSLELLPRASKCSGGR